MAVVLESTTDQQVDEFELELASLAERCRLQFAAQLPPELIAHILRGVYDSLTRDKTNWNEVLDGKASIR